MPETRVFMTRNVLDPFFEDAARQYRRAWAGSSTGERYLPRCWALLVGDWAPDSMRVTELRWAGNVRESDAVVLEEFSDVIVPCFGTPYADGRRGYWCDPRELLEITREVESKGLSVLGSVHMHADVHRFWPEHAQGQLLSECPTAMDEYLFRNGGWPLNMIGHLESVDGQITTRLGSGRRPPSTTSRRPPRRCPCI
ncbi:hypothetical protein GXW82_08020 [Streptacidiphilus sp. 4-A2]|nr:hypothetical protein [Streptacidiphilus sp. 4-A2]